MILRTPDIYEVGPRDGFQNIGPFIPTAMKVAIIEKLLDSGIRRIQLTSFVSPKAIPQLADAREVVSHFVGRYPGVRFGALVPNVVGARAAWECGLREVGYVASVSTHNKANINRTHEQSFAELASIREELPDLNVLFGMATAFACPFEGETMDLLRFAEKAVRLGVSTLELGDTIGMAYPAQAQRSFAALAREFPGIKLGAHFHDTRNNGILSTAGWPCSLGWTIFSLRSEVWAVAPLHLELPQYFNRRSCMDAEQVRV